MVNENGQVLFSPKTEGAFKPEFASNAPDLRQSENRELAAFVTEALSGNTGLKTLTVDGAEYYMAGVPMGTLGWTVISAVDKAVTNQPTAAMLKSYEDINAEALSDFHGGTDSSTRWLIAITVVIVLLAVGSALFVASRVVRPIEHMTRRINALTGDDRLFEMENVYRTNDEIEILAESFAAISAKTVSFIRQITEITAEKERIGTELALATRIQAAAWTA